MIDENTTTMEGLRHELLSDLAQQTKDILKAHGVDDSVADQIGCSLSNHVAEHWGGQVISFPKDYLFKLSLRDSQIYEEFTGNNHSALSRKYDVSVRAIYKIISRTRKKEIDKRQIKMF